MRALEHCHAANRISLRYPNAVQTVRTTLLIYSRSCKAGSGRRGLMNIPRRTFLHVAAGAAAWP